MATTYVQQLRSFNRDVRLFLLTAALVGFAWDGIRGVLLNLYLLRLGFGPEFVGLLTAFGALVFGLFCLPAGALGTRWSSRRMLILGMALMVVGTGLLPLAEFVPPAWQAGWLLGTSLPAQLGFALYLVNGLPFMMGITRPRERSHLFSVHIALTPLAGFAGSLAGGVLPGVFALLLGVSLEDPVAYLYPLLLGSFVLIPSVLALLRTRAVETEQRQVRMIDRGPAPYGLFVAIAVILALRYGGWGMSTTFFNVYMDDALVVPTALIGAWAAAAQVLSVPAALGAPLLVARWGTPRTIAGGTAVMALSMLPLALIPHPLAAGTGFVASAALFSLTIGPIRLFSQELVAPGWWATMAAAFMMGAGLGFSTMSYGGGYIVAGVGYRSLFLLGAALIAVAALVFWAFFRQPRGELARVPASGDGD